METAHPSIQLDRLLEEIEYWSSADVQGIHIASLTADSRQAGPGTLFVALPGLTVDGHRFLQDVKDRGGAAAVIEKGRATVPEGLPVVEVRDTRAVYGLLAAAFYGYPGRKLIMIGLTGTNGKTTTSYLLESMVRASGGRPGVLGTINYRVGDREWPAALTTPEPLLLQRLLGEMVEAGASHAIMEVSSHALAQERLAGLRFDVALFTNLTRDHLDFHGNMEEYYASKKKLFTEHLKEDGRAIVVLGATEPDWALKLAQELPGIWQTGSGHGKQNVITCGVRSGQIRTEMFIQNLQGTTVRLLTPAGSFDVHSTLVGEFNIRNILAAVSAGLAVGMEPRAIAQGIEQLAGVPGRLERVPAPPGVQVFVDYAHTPDALENVLLTLRELGPKRLIVVFGCGGERDRGKRPLMGEVAGRLGDLVLVTSDNPRRESPAAIIADIEPGLINLGLPRMRAEVLLQAAGRGYDVIPDRREAIGVAVRLARPGDVIIISGKGHENYQITNQGKRFFDDRQEVARELAKVA